MVRPGISTSGLQQVFLNPAESPSRTTAASPDKPSFELSVSFITNMSSPPPSYQHSSLHFFPLSLYLGPLNNRSTQEHRVICLSQCAGLWMGSCWGQPNHLSDQHGEQRRLYLLSQTKVNKAGFLRSIADILESRKEGQKNSRWPLSPNFKRSRKWRRRGGIWKKT